ncbi:MAG: DUF2156 domain-containing protein [Lachnospiraceae bacterium]|nr:DUF2156 domain-containing protein [Lachnospiraceae bacterium]
MKFFVPNINDINRIREALSQNEKQNCEMSPANTVLWARRYNTEVAFWNGEIIYRSLWEGERYSYSCNLLNAKNPKALFDRIVKFAVEEPQEFQMHCMSEEEFQMIDQWYPGVYSFDYRRMDSDYIYLREKLATLSGKKLHGKRNHIHRFEERYPDWCYEPITAKNEEDCARMAMRWCFLNCADEQDNWEHDKIDESKLVVYAVRHREELGLTGGSIRVNGEIVAITLGEPLTKDTFVIHFEKAFSEIQGAYPMINREFVRNELEAYTYVNREEDLGQEGLRKAKLSYRPVMLLNKGLIRLKRNVEAELKGEK